MYGYIFYPPGYTSFEGIEIEVKGWPYLAFIIYMILFIGYTIGLSSIPHTMLGELFPFK